ncbi:amidohydrolase [Ramlibacter sp. WS9]|uniref:amidohydrolase n=1 Tax=Ramlibacter sp. WS9 TaxID=1882741 RepID=UPI0011434502|nr:amidohydrolase [Ramlibacter sp. WS9]ROZ78100.1 amidohydrolase [Ramlibacter sp. WS9]HSV36688.1 amidohydrolase [Ramlibacter sp.]
MKSDRTTQRLTLHVALALGLAMPTALVRAQAATPAELVVRSGAIYTVQGAKPWAQAFAVRNGRYIAVGSDSDMARHIGPKTQVIDLKGAMAMPGINDVHAHPLSGAYEDLFACNMAQSDDLEKVLERVAACAKRAAPGGWIVGGGWSSRLLGQIASSTSLEALDKASAGHPTVLRDETYHNRWVSSDVLQRANISAQSADPPNGSYVKDAVTGQPVGLLKEFPAFAEVQKLIPPRTADQMRQTVEAASRTLNGYGITGVQDAASSEQSLRLWSQADRSKALSLRVVASVSMLEPEQTGDRNGMALVGARGSYRTANVRPDFAKLFLDGVPPARTSSFIEPYLPDHEHGSDFRGRTTYTFAQLVEMLAVLDKQGVAAKMHATGDASLHQALDAVEAVRKRNGPKGPRHQIAHASFIADSDLPRFRKLNVTADLSPMLWFPTGLNIATAMAIGEIRAKRIFPIKSLVTAGALVAGGSDWPAGQPTANPWIGIEGMVTRKNPLGEIPGVLGPDQAVDLATAVRIYTINSAQAMGLARETGSIEPGKSADFIVLDRDVFKVPVEQIHLTQVQRTFFQGRLVHSAP